MKRFLALLIVVCLLLCGCQIGDFIPTEAAPEDDQSSAQTPTEKTPEDPTETTPEEPEETIPEEPEETIPEDPTEATEEPTEPTPAPSGKVTVYLLEEAVFFENGYSEYFYDASYNIDTRDDYDIENQYRGCVNYIEKDQNGMPCMIWEETVTEDVHSLTYFEDGNLKEEMLNANEYTYTGWQYAYDEKGNVTEKREYYEGILQSTVIYEYNGEELWSVYCVDPQDTLLYDCIVEDGVITEKVFYYADGNYDCSYRYEYDENGNLVKEYFLYDGEQLLVTTYSYKAVEVDAARAAYILKQQAYLIPIT